MDGAVEILHVDDDPDFAEVTATFLERESDRFAVTTATGAGEGLDRLADGGVDCVVSDYDMPGISGIEFLEAAREDHPDLPFILFTGKGSETIASDAISAGVSDYLQKKSGSQQYALLANRIETVVDQHRARRELERQNDLFAKAQDIADVGAWEYDVETDRSYVSDQILRIHGLSPGSSLAPEESLEYYHPDDRETLEEAFRHAIEAEQPYDLELRLIDANGRKRWVRTRGEPQSVDGRVVRVRGTLQDITHRKSREATLERQRDRLHRFAGIVSHDIRNPLQVASLQLEVARETGEEEAFQQVAEAHDRIETIIEKVLTLAQHGQQLGDTERVDTTAIAKDAWQTVETSTIELRTLGSHEVEADPDRLQQLFENLFRNAVDHADADVTVTVGPIEPFPTATRGGADQPSGFYFEDDGPGIADEHREQVSESGFTTDEEGTGLGLAIVSQIADAHGWEMHVTDGTTGGARFEFVDSLATGPAG